MAQRKGDAAKTAVTNTILNTFKDSFLLDKKIYITVPDGTNGEPVQLALSLTMPKTTVAASPSIDGSAAAWDPPSTDLSAEDKTKVNSLYQKLKSLGEFD